MPERTNKKRISDVIPGIPSPEPSPIIPGPPKRSPAPEPPSPPDEGEDKEDKDKKSPAPEPPSPPSGGGAPSPPSPPDREKDKKSKKPPSPPDREKDKKDKEPKPSDVIPGLEDKETGLEKLQRLSKKGKSPKKSKPPSGGGEQDRKKEKKTAADFIPGMPSKEKGVVEKLREEGEEIKKPETPEKNIPPRDLEKKKPKERPGKPPSPPIPVKEKSPPTIEDSGDVTKGKIKEKFKGTGVKPVFSDGKFTGIDTGKQSIPTDQLGESFAVIPTQKSKDKDLTPQQRINNIFGFDEKTNLQKIRDLSQDNKINLGATTKTPGAKNGRNFNGSFGISNRNDSRKSIDDSRSGGFFSDIIGSKKDFKDQFQKAKQGTQGIAGTTATEWTPEGKPKRPSRDITPDTSFSDIGENLQETTKEFSETFGGIISKAKNVGTSLISLPFIGYQEAARSQERQDIQDFIEEEKEKSFDISEAKGTKPINVNFTDTIQQSGRQKLASGMTATSFTPGGKPKVEGTDMFLPTQKEREMQVSGLQLLNKTDELRDYLNKQGISKASPGAFITTGIQEGLSSFTSIPKPSKFVFGGDLQMRGQLLKAEASQDVSQRAEELKNKYKEKVINKKEELQMKVTSGAISSKKAKDQLKQFANQQQKRLNQELGSYSKKLSKEKKEQFEKIKGSRALSSSIAMLPETLLVGAGTGTALSFASQGVQRAAASGGGGLIVSEIPGLISDVSKGRYKKAGAFGVSLAGFGVGAGIGGRIGAGLKTKTGAFKTKGVTSQDVKIRTTGREKITRTVLEKFEKGVDKNRIRSQSQIDINIPGTNLKVRAYQYTKDGRIQTAGQIFKKGKPTGETFKASGEISGSYAFQRTISGKVRKILKDKNIKVEDTIESLNTQLKNIDGSRAQIFRTDTDIRISRQQNIGKLSRRGQEDLFAREFAGFGKGRGFSIKNFNDLVSGGKVTIEGLKIPSSTKASMTSVSGGQKSTLSFLLGGKYTKPKPSARFYKQGGKIIKQFRGKEGQFKQTIQKSGERVGDFFKSDTDFIMLGFGKAKTPIRSAKSNVNNVISLQKDLGLGLSKNLARQRRPKTRTDQQFKPFESPKTNQQLKQLTRTADKLGKGSKESVKTILGGAKTFAEGIGRAKQIQRFKTRTGIKGGARGLLFGNITTRTLQKQPSREFQTQKQGKGLKTGLKTSQLTKQQMNIGQSPLSRISTGLKSFDKTITDTTTKQLQKPKLDQDLKTDPIQTNINQPTITPDITKTPKKGFTPDRKPKRYAPEGSQRPADVYVKSEGKWEKANQRTISQSQARRLGSYITDQSLSAQFQIRPKTKTKKDKIKKPSIQIPGDYYRLSAHKFREFQKKKGQKKALTNRWIEEAPHRLDTSSEVSQISGERFIAQQRKRQQAKAQRMQDLNKAFSLSPQPVRRTKKGSKKKRKKKGIDISGKGGINII